MHYTAVQYTKVHYTALQYSRAHHTRVQCTMPHDSAVHYTTVSLAERDEVENCGFQKTIADGAHKKEHCFFHAKNCQIRPKLYISKNIIHREF